MTTVVSSRSVKATRSGIRKSQRSVLSKSKLAASKTTRSISKKRAKKDARNLKYRLPKSAKQDTEMEDIEVTSESAAIEPLITVNGTTLGSQPVE
ncbi:hypothetical protein CANCADRAFT_144646 [Tortispora caseinolytica NRRL Y-17796]|uniref:Uncharacterized protein n=1 Tax=Tortispora caseinolytica NRRL Y-17796 TaxID=767744 RepID=A0A1E4T996_9ASCO|nr:hypothetical protein CANCADRAFT_144646 [Tortispora caseinolytica NRRL Y-17796]